MLKTKMFAALASVMLLISITAGFSFWVLHKQVEGFEDAVGENFEAIRLINDCRLAATSLESRYLPTLTRPDLASETSEAEPGVLDPYRQHFEENLEKLAAEAQSVSFNAQELVAIELFELAVADYVVQFDRFLDEELELATTEQRAVARATILKASLNMAEKADALLSLLENSIVKAKAHSIAQARALNRFLGVVNLAMLVIVGIVYRVIASQVLKPISELTDSIRKVQQQDFESIVPVKHRDEIGELANAFNDMSAELRVMKLESDQEMLRLNSESRAILKGFPHPLFILNEQGSLAQSNPAAEKLMAKLDTERRIPLKISRRVLKCVEQDEEYLPDDITDAMLLRAEEREYWYLPRIFRVCDEAGDSFHGWAVALIDVSRVRWLDDMKSDLIGTVSHEVKTPLTSIRMVLHLLDEQKTGPLNERQEKIVGSALDDCEKLLVTLNNLLQLSRSESGARGLDKTPVHAEDLLTEVKQSLAGRLEEVGISLRIQCEEGLPRVLADRQRIRQVFVNLISNAIKQSDRGDEIVLTAGKAHADFDGVRFSVIDHGDGVPAAEQDLIFERFYRAPGQSGEGTGLGLSICRDIVRAHDGRIGVNSAPDRDTEFFFEIPAGSV